MNLEKQFYCDLERGSQLFRECLANVPRDSEESLSKKLMLDTAKGVPGAAATNAVKMSNLLADQGKPSMAKALLGTAGRMFLTAKDLDKAASALGLQGTEGDRLAAISSLAMKATGHNSLSSSLLDIAMKGVVEVQKDALDHLMKQMDGFSEEIGRSNAEAIKAAAVTARPAKPKPKPAETQETKQEPEPTYEPAPTYEPEPQEEPPAAVESGPPACSTWPYWKYCLAKCEGIPGGFSACAARCQENLEVDVGSSCSPD